MDVSSVKEAVDLYQAQYAQVDKLWSYFGTITIAVLGFSVGSDKVTKSILEATIVILGYVVFCMGNFNAIALAQKQLLQFSNIVLITSKNAGIELTSLTPFSVEQIQTFYWAVVVAVSGGILLITLRRHREKTQEAKT